MSRAALHKLTWGTVFAAVMSALLLAVTDGSIGDAESLTGALSIDTLIDEAREPAAQPAEPPPPDTGEAAPGYDLGR